MPNKFPQRKSPRAKWLEYNEGMYFVTVCCQNWIHYFGEITDGEMHLSPIGEFLSSSLDNTKFHQPHIDVLQYVVMPNHFHAIIDVHATDSDTACRVPTKDKRVDKGIKCGRLPLLSAYVGALKSAVTKYAHISNTGFAWQKRFHDHAIRGIEDCNNISEYIENNVLNWDKDCFCNPRE